MFKGKRKIEVRAAMSSSEADVQFSHIYALVKNLDKKGLNKFLKATEIIWEAKQLLKTSKGDEIEQVEELLSEFEEE